MKKIEFESQIINKIKSFSSKKAPEKFKFRKKKYSFDNIFYKKKGRNVGEVLVLVISN